MGGWVGGWVGGEGLKGKGLATFVGWLVGQRRLESWCCCLTPHGLAGLASNTPAPLPPAALPPPACLSAEEQATMMGAFESVRALLLARWPGARVHLFGSVANGLSVRHNNDLDVCLELAEVQQEDLVGGVGGWVKCVCRSWAATLRGGLGGSALHMAGGLAIPGNRRWAACECAPTNSLTLILHLLCLLLCAGGQGRGGECGGRAHGGCGDVGCAAAAQGARAGGQVCGARHKDKGGWVWGRSAGDGGVGWGKEDREG